MREDKFSRTNIILYCLGLLPTVWLGLLTAPAFRSGLPNLITNLAVVFGNPFHIVWCEDSIKTVLIFICAYAMGIGIYLMLATKGSPKRISACVHQVIISHIENHSKKPEEARRRIVELIGDLPRIELFARQRVPGWDVWGNEVDSDIELTGGEPNVR